MNNLLTTLLILSLTACYSHEDRHSNNESDSKHKSAKSSTDPKHHKLTHKSSTRAQHHARPVRIDVKPQSYNRKSRVFDVELDFHVNAPLALHWEYTYALMELSKGILHKNEVVSPIVKAGPDNKDEDVVRNLYLKDLDDGYYKLTIQVKVTGDGWKSKPVTHHPRIFLFMKSKDTFFKVKSYGDWKTQTDVPRVPYPNQR